MGKGWELGQNPETDLAVTGLRNHAFVEALRGSEPRGTCTRSTSLLASFRIWPFLTSSADPPLAEPHEDYDNNENRAPHWDSRGTAAAQARL